LKISFCGGLITYVGPAFISCDPDRYFPSFCAATSVADPDDFCTDTDPNFQICQYKMCKKISQPEIFGPKVDFI
jgi:hypothetical protein